MKLTTTRLLLDLLFCGSLAWAATGCGGSQSQAAKAEAAAPAPADTAAPAGAAPVTAAKIADDFFQSLAAQDTAAAAELFHYPPSYTADQLTEDKRIITRWLAVVGQGLGALGNRRVADSAADVEEATIGGGTNEYWAAQEPPVVLQYAVDFANDGPGYVVLRFTNIGGGIELQTVSFCLPATRKDAAARLAALGASAH